MTYSNSIGIVQDLRHFFNAGIILDHSLADRRHIRADAGEIDRHCHRLGALDPLGMVMRDLRHRANAYRFP